MEERDRVSVTMTFKVGLPNYSSADVQVSYASSALEGETPDQTHQRVNSFVQAKLEEAKKTLAQETAESDDRVEETEKPKKKATGLGGLSRLKTIKKETEQEDSEEEEDDEETELHEGSTQPSVVEAKTQLEPTVKSRLEEIRAKYGSGSSEKSGGSLLSKLKR